MSGIARRDVLGGGGLVVLFALAGTGIAQEGGTSGGGEGTGAPPEVAPGLPGSLAEFPHLDAWIRIAPDGAATVFTGKAELGQGIGTALLQIAADELDLPLERVKLITADTGRTPDEGITSGSQSLQNSGTAIANAAANVRYLLAERAARLFGVAVDTLSTVNGFVRARDGRQASYGELAASLSLHVEARPDVRRKRVAARDHIGRDRPRRDIPPKLTGAAAYVHDMTMPGMLHARVIRGPAEGTRLTAPDFDAIARLPGIERVVRVGDFAAMLGPREWPLVQAMLAVGRMPWTRSEAPLPQGDLRDMIRALSTEPDVILMRDTVTLPSVRRVTARYDRPYLMHGAIGPSCAVALWQDGELTVWTHSQGVYPLRNALAELLDLPPERIRCIHREGAGCYGHNGADDVATDAALAARAVPGRPVKLMWTREQEHGWEPLGPAMVTELSAGVDANGRIAEWTHAVWSNTHSTRPSQAGDLLAGLEVGRGFAPSPPRAIPQPNGGGDRNAIPLYTLPRATITSMFVPQMPVRVSALRGLGAHMNVFAIESMIDELAAVAKSDPVEFRLRHLEDPRAIEVIRTLADRFGWARPKRERWRGQGFGFARYKNSGAYCAVAIEVRIEPETGATTVLRADAAVDAGETVSPDGLRNQIEGGIVQSISWTAHEEVRFDAARRTAFDWSSYPILRFDAVPLQMAVHVVDRPGQPFLGAGEASQGPAAAAFANAIARATGQRLRSMPLTAERVRLALAAR
ncbi:molybdopterin cofactor-binding domain-containing protein [Blastomonas sp.]|uniref:xanthine dehydrogenase family protein molybdopterin-binding subunit n=1 Tax=Blastomonas sp. TaxID=1909299 RepID=UPI0026355F83|nr:molybdopterin cofactor-binding domain-containing protein [Blastomonas sp.]MDM7956995.1 molybdopterin-dependent oxidoreductase [Blastomonas sp.]